MKKKKVKLNKKQVDRILNKMTVLYLDKVYIDWLKKNLPPLYVTKSVKISKKVLRPGKVLRTKSGKIKRFKLTKIK